MEYIEMYIILPTDLYMYTSCKIVLSKYIIIHINLLKIFASHNLNGAAVNIKWSYGMYYVAQFILSFQHDVFTGLKTYLICLRKYITYNSASVLQKIQL